MTERRASAISSPRPRGGRCTAWLAVTLLMLASSGIARAQTAPAADAMAENERLHELFERAGVALDREAYAEALELLREIWRARRTADVAANLAVAEMALGEPAAAGRHAAFAKHHLLPSAKPEQREAIEALLARARREAAVLVIEVVPAGAEVSAGGERIGTEELAEVFVTPGAQIVTATLYGATVERRLDVAAGARAPVTLNVPPPDAGVGDDGATPARSAGARPPTADFTLRAERRRRPSLIPLMASAGVAAAGGVMAVGFGVASRRAGDDATALSAALVRSDPTCDPTVDPVCAESICRDSADPRCDTLADRREQEARQADLEVVGFVAAGAGAVAAIISGVVYAVRVEPRSAAQRGAVLRASGVVQPSSAWVGVSMGF